MFRFGTYKELSVISVTILVERLSRLKLFRPHAWVAEYNHRVRNAVVSL